MGFPKILIVGQYFNTDSGGGITMTNLFKGWDKENVAVVAENIINPDFDICNNYYQLGSKELKRRFPFNLNRWKKPVFSGVLQKKISSSISTRIQNTAKLRLKRMYLNLLHFMGLYHYKSRYQISKEMLTWIKGYSPEIIYTQLSSIELILLVKDLHKKLGLPIAIHMMDDWPVTISKRGLFQSYWRKTIDREFRYLLAQSKVLMSISESMSEEYMVRYDCHFIPFHNPIDILFWNVSSRTNYNVKDCFVILYAGRIGTGIQNIFFDIAEAIHRLRLKGLNVEFHIQATNYEQILDELAEFDFIKLYDMVPYRELPKIFSSADLLVLPNDFDENAISYLRYSMPTKASEYMVSGSPILLYSSSEMAVTRHAMKYQWAYIISEKDIEKLEIAIFELYNNEDLRSKLATSAKEYAIKHFESGKVRTQFRNYLKVTAT